jgi:ketosteroid isomerase-like protein
MAAARAWIDGWMIGWREHEVDRIVALYADEATHYSAPFREPTHGPRGVREYVEWAFAEEDEVEPRFGEPVVADDCAAVEWWTLIRYQGKEQTLAGVSLIRFGQHGRVVEQRDYWHVEDGRKHAVPGWGFSRR